VTRGVQASVMLDATSKNSLIHRARARWFRARRALIPVGFAFSGACATPKSFPETPAVTLGPLEIGPSALGPLALSPSRAPAAGTSSTSSTVPSTSPTFEEEPSNDDHFEAKYPSVVALCEAFLAQAERDRAEIAQRFSFTQIAPACIDRGPFPGFAKNAVFTDARILETAAISKKEKTLALRLDGLWVRTSIRWDTQDSESASRAWQAEQPERLVVTQTEVIAYAQGADRNNSASNRPRGGPDQFLLGAMICKRKKDTAITCLEWDPTEQPPLGTKTVPSGTRPPTSMTWSDRWFLGSDGAGYKRVRRP
jgi:hypothetical protein